jgi:hypothetical protein
MRFSCAADCCAAAEPIKAGNPHITRRQSEKNENFRTGHMVLLEQACADSAQGQLNRT